MRDYPAVALFLTVGAGFLIGKLKIGSFSLGSVTSVLLVGIAVGQLHIPMSGPLKTFFFMMFLFSIGYSVGPVFFKSLKGMGLKQVFFAVLMSASCFGVTLLLAKLFSYSVGETVGLFSGSQTCSSLIGVGGEAIGNYPGSEAFKERELDIIPVCYAVTYVFGTLGTVIILGNFGPKLLGGIEKVKRATAELEKRMAQNAWEADPGCINALRVVAYRSYEVENEFFACGRTVAETERYLRDNGLRLFVDRVRSGGRIYQASPSVKIGSGDQIVLCGRREFIVKDESLVGPETADEELLTYPVEQVPVLLSKRRLSGCRVAALLKRRYMHGVTIESITRNDRPVEITPLTRLELGDILTIQGQRANVNEAARHIGHMDRPTTSSDLMFVGLAIFIGGVLGAITFMLGDVPVSFGTSGGALVAGLVFGWLRSRKPVFGQIPRSALWIMNNLGLNVFIAVIGIEAAPSFVAGLKAVGPMLLVAGMIGTTIPLLFGLWLGHRVFRFNPAITLGCCAGTRTCTASLGAVQDALDSTLPAMGYTTTYAVSNILLVIWGLLTVGLMY